MKRCTSSVLVACLVLLLDYVASAAPSLDSVTEAMRQNADRRPRLLVDDGTFRRINDSAQRDGIARRMQDDVLADAELILPQPPAERKMTGRRLLAVSRTVLHRVATLATAYRLTGDERFLRRAEREMLAAAGFRDWNPSHFLDVAEMTTALAIGYDWLYEDLAPEARQRIHDAILDKGLRPSVEGPSGWSNLDNNWNQVCNGGLAMGALAVMDDQPELAARIVLRAVRNVPTAMKAGYDPDGTYPEGPGYWSYGTTYNVLMIASLRSALGTDFGLARERGFDKTVDYFNEAIGPGGRPFNYADCWPWHVGCEPAVYWFAAELNRPWWRERTDELLEDDPKGLRDARFGWAALLWRDGRLGSNGESPPLDWLGRGPKPVAMHRSSWTDANAAYVGICAGRPGSSHGHMDIGSFIFAAGGVRWAIDLGAQDYESLESRHVDLWNMRQDGQRWDVFRLNNLSHNTLVVNGRLQRVDGAARLVASSDDRRCPFDVVDMTNVYRPQAGSIVRGVAMPGRRTLVVHDKIDRLAEDSQVRWGFVTEADAAIQSPRHAVLVEDGRQLVVDVLQPEDAKLELLDTATPKRSFDAPNPGTHMLAFTTKAAQGEPVELVVVLRPAGEPELSGADQRFVTTPPIEWSKR